MPDVYGLRHSGPGGAHRNRGRRTPETPKSLAYYHFLKAQQLLVADDTAGAIQEYEAAIQGDPESSFLEMDLAALYQRQGDVKQALAHAEKSLKLNPRQQEAYFLLAGLHVGLNQLDDATREYERIFRFNRKTGKPVSFWPPSTPNSDAIPKLFAPSRNSCVWIPNWSSVSTCGPHTWKVGEGLAGSTKKNFCGSSIWTPSSSPAMLSLGATLEQEHQYSRALTLYRRILRSHPATARSGPASPGST